MTSRTNRSSRRALATAALALGLATAATACGGGGAMASATTRKDQGGATKAGTIKINDAWARITVAGQPNGAAYFVIHNDGAADRLIKAKGPADLADRTEVHEVVAAGHGGGGHDMPTTAAGGAAPGSTAPAMAMREVTGVDIPAKSKVEFKPGGYHVMFIGLKKPIAKDDAVELTLTFEKAGDVKVNARGRER